MTLLQNVKDKRVTPWVATAVTLIMVAAMVWLRLAMAWRFVLPVGYGVPIVIIAWFRNRFLLWSAVAIFILLTVIKFFFLLPYEQHAAEAAGADYWVAAALIIIDLLVVATVSQFWIIIQDHQERQTFEMEAVNAELVAREEDLARVNEELQSQTEELERQGEELRLANDELADREKILQILLDLSRSLTTELSRAQTMTRICQSLAQLVGEDGSAAILQRDGQQMKVLCHHGFGPDGIAVDSLPAHKSFAALVLERGQTGYLQDVSLRPDLEFPQPVRGRHIASVLAVPLWVGASAVGTLEVYSDHKQTWSPRQVALAESLASQTSVSLEAAGLFEEISRERNRFETVLRTMPFAVMIADADCRDVRLNPAGAALFGAPGEDNIAHLLAHMPLQKNGRQVGFEQLPIVRACRENVEIFADELEWVSPRGTRSMLLANARPIHNRDGVATGAVAAFIDITPQKELQRELDLRRREAEEASVRKTRFLAAVSHDIRTPANAISLLAELMRRTASNPSLISEIPGLADELQGSAMALVNLLSEVLDVARFDSGKIELQESEFDLAELLEEEHRQMLPLARHKGLELTISAPRNAVRLRTDRIKLSRILGNLVGNAIKFTEHGGVRVEADAPTSSGLSLRVIDTGVGIAPEFIEHIFDEFFQLRNPERDRNKGIGLGLTICRRLVDAMGGKMEVRSTPGTGSTFTVMLPPDCVRSVAAAPQ